MKLSELSTDRSLDVLCELTPYLTSIASDEELLAEIKRKVKLPEDATRTDLISVGVDKLNKIVPILLKQKRGDIYGILSVINETTVDEIGKQNVIKTMAQIRDLIKDKEFIDFFKSCVDSEGSE